MASPRILVIVATLVVVPACGGPTQPSPPRSPSPVLYAPPRITSVEPHTVLTGGGAPVRIDGTGFRTHTTLTVGGVKVLYYDSNFTSNSGEPNSIYAAMPAHAPGLVDITVTNDDGQSATLAGALTYLPIEDYFDFNGSWEGRGLSQNQDWFTPRKDWDISFQLTVERDHVVSFTCGASGVTVLDPAPPWHNSEFTYTGANGLAINGGARTPTYIEGFMNVPSCEGTYWYAIKK